MGKTVILTGLRANSEFHIGNYLGALEPIVRLAAEKAGEFQINLFVPDLHSITTPIDYSRLQDQILHNLKAYAAAGLNVQHPDIYIYRQSYIPAHTDMTWILDCFTGFGEASRMLEFKDKSQQLGEDRVSVGQFNYPLLMAADILLYGAKWVPVGDDQRQHIELTRDLAMRLNNKFGELLVVPEEPAKQLAFAGREHPVRIRSLRNPDKKMSKSIDDPAGTIFLSDKPEAAVKKVNGATTDSVGKINFDFNTQPGVSNLLQLLSLLSTQSQQSVNEVWVGKSNYGELKQAVADAVYKFLHDFQAKLSQVDEQVLLEKLEQSETNMRAVANETLLKVQMAVGLRS